MYFLGSASEGAQQSLQEVYHKVWVFFVTAVFKDYKPDIYLYSKIWCRSINCKLGFCSKNSSDHIIPGNFDSEKVYEDEVFYYLYIFIYISF